MPRLSVPPPDPDTLSPPEEHVAPLDMPDPALPMALIASTEQAHVEHPMVNPNTEGGQIVLTVDQALFHFSQHAATVLASIDQSWDAALRVLNHNNAATLALKEALQSYSPAVPYSATISTLTPSGFPLTLTVQDRTREGFLEHLGGLLGWLKTEGFQPLV